MTAKNPENQEKSTFGTKNPQMINFPLITMAKNTEIAPLQKTPFFELFDVCG
jgi:hypothetical protein